jgi:uridine kinase
MTTELLPVVLMAGIPGSGKTTVASYLSGSVVLPMDEFYLAGDNPRVPHRFGRPDWEAIGSLDMEAVGAAAEQLVRREPVSIPCYDMRRSQPYAQRRIDPTDACAVIIEGVHAFALRLSLIVPISRVLLVSSGTSVFFRRLKRDVQEGRFSPTVALLQAIPVVCRYRRYNRSHAQQADYVFLYRGEPATIANQIQQRVAYWDNC